MLNQIPRLTKGLIIINVLMFIASEYLIPTHISNLLAAYFPLSPNFRSWQIVTHMFMHGGWMHLLFNMVGLWSFGPVLERVLGEKKYLILYFMSGLGAFIVFNLWNYYQYYDIIQALQSQGADVAAIFRSVDLEHSVVNFNQIFSDGSAKGEMQRFLLSPMVGASGALFGVLAAFAVLFPDAKLIFLFIPFPIKAKILFPIFIAGSLYLGLAQRDGDNIAHFAHLGGAIVGFILVKLWSRNRFRIQ